MTNCDKCGKPVQKQDSATWLSVMAGEMSGIGLFVYHDRHIRCSPSRAQYIFDDIIDERPEFDKRLKSPEYVQESTRLFRKAYEDLQSQP